MAVLSDTIAVLAKGGAPRELAVRVVEGLHAAMKPERVGLFEWPDEGGPQLVYGISRSGLTSTPVESLDTSAEERRLLDSAVAKRRTAFSCAAAPATTRSASRCRCSRTSGAWACCTSRAAPPPPRSTRPTSCSWRRSPARSRWRSTARG